MGVTLPRSDKQQVKELTIALEESLKLQAHYAELLNGYDGGRRIIFKTKEKWLNRLEGQNKI